MFKIVKLSLLIAFDLSKCFELLKFDKYLEKEGLHRDLITNISLKIDN